MSERVVCSRCAVISRGFTGHCKHVMELIQAELERCVKVAETEPELEGQMPEANRIAAQKIDLEDHLRATVRATKKNIARRMRE